MPDALPYLLHFSEDPAITRFEPTVAPGSAMSAEPCVWAIAPERAPLYLFPRDCPRIGYWAKPTTSASDRYRFLSQTGARRVLVVESAWVSTLCSCELFAYRLPPDLFMPTGMDGYYTSKIAVTPLSVVPVGDLLEAITADNNELRITPSLWELHDALQDSTLHFSTLRMRYAAPRADTMK
ncbi:MAG: hypothetical protein H7Y38_06905 [Armatimonadetes bacterium]|nr:hypothetical protein [Armatimonadota bacterium]